MRRLANDLWRVLGEIYAGGSALESATPDAHDPHRCRKAVGLHDAEDGMLTLTTAVAVLALAVLIGFIGNAGNAVKEKIELQNAADSAAYSSALWMARGMNAITTTNHLLGELTALSVIHEALGGPILDHDRKFNTNQSNTLNQSIDALKDTAPIGATTTNLYGEKLLERPDTILIDEVVNMVKKEHEAGATIYDAKLRLKTLLKIALLTKSAANPMFLVPYPWGVATAAAAYALHFAASATIIKIGQEWILLNVLRDFAKSGAARQLKLTVIEEQLIPLLSRYGDQVAGYPSNSTVGSSSRQAGMVNSAIEETISDLQDKLPVRKLQLALFPVVQDIRLPVVPEPLPRSGGSAGKPGTGNVGNNPVPGVELLGKLSDLEQAVSGDLDAILKRVDKLKKEIDSVSDKISKTKDKLKDQLLSVAKRAGLKDDLEKLEDKLAPLKDELAGIDVEALKKRVDEFQAQVAGIRQATNSLSGSSVNGNPSIDNLPEFDWQREKVTQWVRATYPQMDSFRAPIRGLFNSPLLMLSNSGYYYTQWSNRYTLVKSYQLRDGREWQPRGQMEMELVSGRDRVRMHVLKDTFDQGDRPRKSREPWTTKDREAEKLFTLVGFAHREAGESLFAPIVFHNPNSDGFLAHAQAIVYNANEQKKSSGAGATQPKVGWDTLNWKPPVSASEWGQAPSESGSRWPWEVLSSGGRGGNTEVKLNWQAKLVPVTASRMSDARGEQKLPSGVRRVLKKTKTHFAELVTH